MANQRAWRVLVVAALATAVVLRIWVLRGPLGAVDSDEAVVGLMARHAQHGEFRTFFWGQSYGGTPAVGLNVVLFALFGSSVLTLKLAPILATVAALVLLWRVGRRTFGEPVATLATVLFAVWPGTYVWWSTKERLFYWPCLALGLLVLLTALRVAERPRRWLDWVAMGFAGGIGWWATPQIIFFVVPAVLWLVLRDWRHLTRLPIAGAAALVGAAPWLRVNLAQHFISLKVPPQPVREGYLDHLQHLFAKGLPTALGLRVAYSGKELFGVAAVVAYVLLIGVIVWSIVRRPDGAGIVVLLVCLFPFIYAVSPYTWFIGEGRYVLFVTPFLALLIAHAARGLPVAATALAVVVAVLVSVAGLRDMRGLTEPYAPDVHVPRHAGALVAALRRAHADRVYTDYWLAYRLSFETDERVIATPTTGTGRNERYDQLVREAASPAWVFVSGSQTVPRFRTALDGMGVGVRELRPKGFVVMIPDRALTPEQLPENARP